MLLGGELDSCGSLASFPEIIYMYLSLVWFHFIINNLLHENHPHGLQRRRVLESRSWGRGAHEC